MDSRIAQYKSYLEDIYFLINIENSFLDQASLSCGVPQGSIIGPHFLTLRKWYGTSS